MIHPGWFLLVLAAAQSATPPDAVKESLRTHLRGSLSMSRTVSFDEPPLKGIGAKCDLVRTLIEILEEKEDTPDRREESVSAVSVLAQYWIQNRDDRVPASLSRYALDASRPKEVRAQAIQRRGLIPDPGAPRFYAQVLWSAPELASPLVAWLKATPGGLPNWLTIQELYTPEVREALKSFVDTVLQNPALLPGDREYYSSLIPDLDRAVGKVAAPGAPVAPPVDVPKAPPTRTSGSTIGEPRKPVDAESGADSGTRPLMLVALLGVCAAVVLFLTIRRK